ncbi:hypothetical protein Hte_003650 [Hypoxylon texense]
MSLAGKQCIISGGSRGIGLSIARVFAAEGAACTLVGRDRGRLAAIVETLKRNDDAPPHDISCFDVGLVNGWEKLKADTKHQKCDILVNAAGIPQNSFLFAASPPDLDALVTTNLMGTIWGCRYFVPKMMKQKDDMDKNGELSALIPMGRLGLPTEVAKAALFLATNTYAHNCVLNIDGGLSAT